MAAPTIERPAATRPENALENAAFALERFAEVAETGRQFADPKAFAAAARQAAAALRDYDSTDLITQAGAAELLHVHAETIRRRIAAGKLRAYKLKTGQSGEQPKEGARPVRSQVLVRRADVLGMLSPVGTGKEDKR
ncbi:MAG: hypothetical protein H0U25_06230 [Thermoleophilaceae bacterium]|nr:hypothetical protein [Thermoleophilaceae bacterium]